MKATESELSSSFIDVTLRHIFSNVNLVYTANMKHVPARFAATFANSSGCVAEHSNGFHLGVTTIRRKRRDLGHH